MIADRLFDDFLGSGLVERSALRGMFVVAIGLLVVVLGAVLTMMGGLSPLGPALVGLALVGLGGFMVASAARATRHKPAGTGRCPRCGATPPSVTASGFARCTNCGERFFV